MHKANTLRLVLLAALLLIAVSPVHGQGEANTVVVAPGSTIKVAVATDLTGPIAEFGLDIQQGAEVALADLNDAGGIKGFPVEFIVEDDRCDAAEGTLVANRNASNPEIVAVVGHICSGPTIAASEIYAEARIPMMSPSATNPTVTERGFDVVNRVVLRDDLQGNVDANYLYKVLGVEKLAILHDNADYGLGIAQYVNDFYTALGGEVVAFEGLNVQDQDYRPVLTPLVADQPDAIFFGGYVQQAVLLVPQKNDVGLQDVVFFSDDGVFGDAFLDGAQDAAEGAYASFPAAGESDPARVDKFFEEYDAMFGDTTGPYHLNAYDAASAVFAAIDTASTLDDQGNLVIDREALVAAVRGTKDFPGLTGTLTCDDKGECAAGFISVNMVEDGEWVQMPIPDDLISPE